MVTSLLEQRNRRIPDYYPTMYLEGFTPEEVMYAAKRQMYRQIQERKMMQTDLQTALEAALHDVFKDWK